MMSAVSLFTLKGHYSADAVMLLSYRSRIVLVLNGETVDHAKEVNSTTTMFHLINVRVPLSVVHCKLKRDSWNDIVAGADLQGGRMYS